MTGAVVGAQREIVVRTVLPVVLLATLMMVMRVVYAATVLDRTRG